MDDPTSPKQASELLRAYGLRPQKRLGQSFLCDRNTLHRIVRAANLTPDDPIIEIGSGLGALTIALAPQAASVTTIEIDRHLEPILRAVTAPFANVRLLFEDFLRVDLAALFAESFGDTPGVVVGNLPYYITTPILERLLAHKAHLKRIVLLVQEEFGRRMVALPDTEEYGAMSLFAQYHARVEIFGVVPRTVFLPSPEVDSAVITLEPAFPGTVTVQDEARLFRLIRAAFGQRRKTLLNALLRAPASFSLGFTLDDRAQVEALLARTAIDPNRRGETLSLQEFARLADASLASA